MAADALLLAATSSGWSADVRIAVFVREVPAVPALTVAFRVSVLFAPLFQRRDAPEAGAACVSAGRCDGRGEGEPRRQQVVTTTVVAVFGPLFLRRPYMR